MGHPVGPGPHGDDVAEHRRGRAPVRAAVEQHGRADADQGAVGLGGVPVGQHGGVAVDVAEEGFLRVHTIRTGRPVASAARQAWICRVTSSRPPNAPPTPPSRSRTSEGSRPRHAAIWSRVGVQPLRGDDELDATVRARGGQGGLGGEERLVLHADGVGVLDDDGALGVVAAAHVELPVGGGRKRRVRQGGQRFPLDADERGGAAGGLARVGDDEGDGLAVEAGFVDDEDGLVGRDQAETGAAGDVGGGEDGVHPLECQCSAPRSGEQPGVRVRTTDGRGPQRVVGGDVTGVGELAADLGAAIGTGGAVAQPMHHAARACATSSTAATIRP